MFEFAWPWLFWLLPLPILVRFLLPRIQRTAAAIWMPQARYLAPEPTKQNSAQWSRWLLPSLIWIALVSAAAHPRWVGEPIALNPEAREIMIALDLSGSMQMDDMELNGRTVTRLEAAHAILADFIRRRSGDRIGLIVYADSAHVYVPITSDLETVATMAEEAFIGLAGQRTALGDAIALSIRYFVERDSKERVVLMLTDGMINTGQINAEQAIQLAKSHDVKIHTIGIGSDEVTVRGIFGERRLNPSADLDEIFLNEVARATGGEYFRARSTEEMERIYELIDRLEPIASDDQYLRPQRSLVHYPLILALIVWLLMLLPSPQQLRGRLWSS
ncbi:VWA domain-containing protein [Aliidiomarina halalkaliphila]|uniref:VWA domain-containing protein n=1 Tax=Aliidiomarina halalkaliphila TaxID=2593535 RepID=A0A552X2V6_9GAMM|nr:VWA domain-containing protein [Aliidiomarina halalkaliphila]TRW49368.1 VWA domain-containing protein [Aliidiomarina halalkaliphila]